MFLRYALILLLVISCTSTPPSGKTAAEILYKEAKSLVDGGHYLLATEKLNAIKSQYPYSYYATHAELMLADILFAQESFVESAAAYLLFRDFHPKHKQSGYVLFRIAESYFYQLPSTHDRDLAAAFEAIKYYSDLINYYPGSKHTKLAGKRIKKCKKMIEDKEQYIADFYYKTEEFGAARVRYQMILDQFERRDLRAHSISRIVQSSLQLKEFQKCIDVYNKYKGELSKSASKTIGAFVKSCKDKL